MQRFRPVVALVVLASLLALTDGHALQIAALEIPQGPPPVAIVVQAPRYFARAFATGPPSPPAHARLLYLTTRRLRI